MAEEAESFAVTGIDFLAPALGMCIGIMGGLRVSGWVMRGEFVVCFFGSNYGGCRKRVIKAF